MLLKTNQLMPYREIIAVYSERTQNRKIRSVGMNLDFLNVKPGDPYSNHTALKS